MFASTLGDSNQTGGNANEVQSNGKMTLEASDIGNQKRHQRRGSKTASVFPTKKRVQVPPYASTSTEMDQERLKDKIVEINRSETKVGPVLQNDMPSTSERGKHDLPPFFWLREEHEDDKLTQQSDDTTTMYTPPEFPCFSDMKDSDDEVCSLSDISFNFH